jgi:hypothetical protein
MPENFEHLPALGRTTAFCPHCEPESRTEQPVVACDDDHGDMLNDARASRNCLEKNCNSETYGLL